MLFLQLPAFTNPRTLVCDVMQQGGERVHAEVSKTSSSIISSLMLSMGEDGVFFLQRVVLKKLIWAKVCRHYNPYNLHTHEWHTLSLNNTMWHTHTPATERHDEDFILLAFNHKPSPTSEGLMVSRFVKAPVWFLSCDTHNSTMTPDS